MGIFDDLTGDQSSARAMQLQGLLGGLTQMGGLLAQAGQFRPVGTPAPSLADAFNGFGVGQQQGLMKAKQRRDMTAMQNFGAALAPDADEATMTPTTRAMRNAVPANIRPILGALPSEVQTQVLSQLMTRKSSPKDNLQVVGRFIYDVSSGQPKVVAEASDTMSAQRMAQDMAVRAAGRSVQNVSVDQGPQVGTIPPGWQLSKTPEGAWTMTEIPGGPAARATAETAKKAGLEQANTARAGDVVTQDIGRALKLIEGASLPTAGLGATTLARVPGTSAADVARLVDSVKANVSFQTLTEMRKASPTGGALGAVSDKEMAMLQASLGSLEQSQSPQQYRDNLARVNNQYLDIIHGPQGGPPRLPLSFQQPAPGGPPQGGAGGATMRWNPQTQRVEPVR